QQERDQAQECHQAEFDAQSPGEQEEDGTLPRGNDGTPQHFAEHHGPARNGGHQDALEETLSAVLDNRDGREDGREEKDQNESTWKVVLEKGRTGLPSPAP